MNRYLVILLGLFLSFQASGQQTPLDSLIDYILMGDEEAIRLLDSEKDEHFLYLSTGFSPHTYYAGREIGDNILNISGQAIYLHPKGFYMGVAGGWYQQLQPQYNMTMLSVGWSDKLKKSDHLRLRGSFGHYIFTREPSGEKPAPIETINIGTTLYKKKSGARLDYTLLAGEGLSHQLSLDLYRKIPVARFGKYSKIAVLPEISLFMGQEVVEYELTTFTRARFTTEPVYISDERFGLLNTRLILPVLVSMRNFELEASYTYNLPRSLDPLYFYDKTSQWSISVGYLMGLRKK